MDWRLNAVLGIFDLKIEMWSKLEPVVLIYSRHGKTARLGCK